MKRVILNLCALCLLCCGGRAGERVVGPGRALEEIGAIIQPAVRVSWPSEIGKAYSVEASLDLQRWHEVAAVQSQGCVTSWYEAVVEYPRRFYRVRQKESARKLVAVVPAIRAPDLYVVYSDGAGSRQIKRPPCGVWFFRVSPHEDKVLYTEEVTPGSEVCDLRLYDLASGSTTTLATGVGRVALFDPRDPLYCLYCDSQANLRRARMDNFPGETLVDSPYRINFFWPSGDGSVIVTMEPAGPGMRLVAYDASGGLIRVLDEGIWDLWNFSVDRTGQRVWCSYVDAAGGMKRIKIIHVRTIPVACELPSLLPLWTQGSFFLAWSPYDNLLHVGTGDFYSPVDGSLAKDNVVQPGVNWFGWDAEGYWYRASPDLTQVQRIEE